MHYPRVPGFTALLLLLSTAPLFPQNAPAPTVLEHVGTAIITQASGGSVRIPRGLGAVAIRSTLELQWVMDTDSTLGIVFDAPVGASGVYDDPWFRYESNMKMRALVPVQAFEVRILTFDVWHQFTGTLSFSQLEDLASGQQKDFDRVWGIYGESNSAITS